MLTVILRIDNIDDDADNDDDDGNDAKQLGPEERPARHFETRSHLEDKKEISFYIFILWPRGARQMVTSLFYDKRSSWSMANYWEFHMN